MVGVQQITCQIRDCPKNTLCPFVPPLVTFVVKFRNLTTKDHKVPFLQKSNFVFFATASRSLRLMKRGAIIPKSCPPTRIQGANYPKCHRPPKQEVQITPNTSAHPNSRCKLPQSPPAHLNTRCKSPQTLSPSRIEVLNSLMLNRPPDREVANGPNLHSPAKNELFLDSGIAKQWKEMPHSSKI